MTATSAETDARAIVLAEALVAADGQHRLLDAAQHEAALQSARREAEGRAGGPPADHALVAAHARHLVDRLAAHHPTLARLAQPGALWRWALIGLPLAALLLGIGTDRIANPHRVDLLSWPLLAVVFWNLAMYAVLAGMAAWSALAPRRTSIATAPLLAGIGRYLQRWHARHLDKPSQVVTAFYAKWNVLAQGLTLQRCRKLLHLSAAAWGAGIALSLAARGLVVEYQVGWESTFLDAAQVHRLLGIIFWLPSRVFGMAPFGFDEVAALRNFQGAGRAGDRWVLMYVGLLALAVVVPRLLLCAWAWWRERVLAARLQVDLGNDYFRGLLGAMRPVRVTVGLAVGDADAQAQWLRALRWVADDPLAQHLTLTTPKGDSLLWIEEAVVARPVDVVLHVVETDMASVWNGRPTAAVEAGAFRHVWDAAPLLLKALAASHPALRGDVRERLEVEWTGRQAWCQQRSMTAVADYLAQAAAPSSADPPQHMAQARVTLFHALQTVHWIDRTTRDVLETRMATRYLPAPASVQPVGAAAGAAAGAGIGGAVDAATGFLSLGAGIALGSLLGAGIGWAAALRRDKSTADGVALQFTAAALLLYLEVANTVRVHPAGEARRTEWQQQIEREVRQRKAAIAGLWSRLGDARTSAAAKGELAALLAQVVVAVISGLYPAAPVFEVVHDAPRGPVSG